MISEETRKVIRDIAGIQKEALNNLLLHKEEVFEDHLCTLLGLSKEELTQEAVAVLERRIRIYSDMEKVPQQIFLLSEYQLGVCSHILFKMEEEWLIHNSEGVFGAWELIREAMDRYHPEYKLIL